MARLKYTTDLKHISVSCVGEWSSLHTEVNKPEDHKKESKSSASQELHEGDDVCEYLTTPEGYARGAANISEQISRCINSIVAKGKVGELGGRATVSLIVWITRKENHKKLER